MNVTLVRILRSILTRGAGALVAFGMNVVVARSLSQESAGLFFLSVGIVTALAPIFLVGTNLVSLRLLGPYAQNGHWSKVNGVVRATTGVAATFLLIGTLALFLSAENLAQSVFQKHELGGVLQLAAPAVFFSGFAFLLASQLQAVEETAKSMAVLVIVIPTVTISAALLFSVRSAEEFATLYSGACMVATLVGIVWWLGIRPTSGREKIDGRKIYDLCLSFLPYSVMTQVLKWGGLIVAGIWVSSEEVAQLAVSQRLAMMVGLLVVVTNFVVAPRLSGLHERGDMPALRKLVRNVTLLMVVISLPAVAIAAVFGSELMSVFGDVYSKAYPLLLILIVGQAVNVATGPAEYVLMMCGCEGDMRNILFLSGFVAVSLPVVLVQLIGVVGVAVGISVAMSLQNIAAVWMLKRRLGFGALG